MRSRWGALTSVELRANTVTEEERYTATALLVKSDLQRFGDGVLSRVVETSQEDDETLLASGRVAFTECLDNSATKRMKSVSRVLTGTMLQKHELVTEPIRNGSTGLEPPAKLCTRDIKSLYTLGYLINRLVLIHRRHISHLLEWHHLNLDLVAVLGDKVLCIIRTIEVLSLRVLPRTSVITNDNEMRRTKVLTDDSVPDGFARTSHTHGEGKESEVTHTVGVLCHDSLVDTNTCVVIDVAGFGETDDGVDEDVGLALTGGEDGEFTVSAVHGVTSLESDDFAPGNFVEVCTEFGRGV